jgi:PAS domain S-box-containing protein
VIARALASVLLLLLQFVTCAAFAAPSTLHVGVLVESDLAVDQQRWAALAPYLEDRLPGTDVDVRVYAIADMDRAIRTRTVDLIVTNAAHFIATAQRVGLSPPLATLVDSADGRPIKGVGGAILVRSDRRDLQTLDDLEQRTIAAAGVHSLLGYQAQAYELHEAGVLPPIGRRLIFTGDPYRRAVAEVLEGRADAAFVRAGTLEELEASGTVPAGALRVLRPVALPGYPYRLSTPLYPNRAVTAMPQLDEALARRVASALLDLGPDEPAARAIGIDGFTLPLPYEPVREVARALHLPPYEAAEPVRWRDVWHQHRYLLVDVVLSAVAVFVLLVLLAVYAGRLRRARDASERHAVALREEQHRLEVVLNALPDLVWLKDGDGVYRFCNPACEAIYGRSKTEIIGRTDADFGDPEMARQFREEDARAIAGGVVRHERELVRAADGARITFLVTMTAVRDISGGLLGVLGVARDVTELRRTQEQLGERIKEQRCLHAVFRATEDVRVPVPDVFTRVVELLPPGMQWPAACAACIEWDGTRYATDGFDAVVDRLVAPLRSGGRPCGTLTIGYVMPKPTADEGPFLKEERALIDAIALRLSGMLDRAAQELESRHREEIYLAIVSQAIEGMTLVDVETLEFVEFNDTACAQLGYTREEFAALRLPDIQAELDEPTIRRLSAHFLAAGEAQFDTQRRRKDGTVLDVRVSLKVLRLKGRDHFSLIWTDVTERRRQERELQESEARFRKLFEDVRQPVVLIRKGRIVDANRATLELLRVDAFDRIRGLTPVDLSPPTQPDGRDSAGKAKEMMEIAFARGAHRYLWTHRRPDGEEFIAEVLCTPIEIGGEPHLHVIWNDVTTRVVAERTLRESEERYRLLAENGGDVVWLYDVARQCYVYVSPSSERLTGHRPEDLLGRSLDLPTTAPGSPSLAGTLPARIAAFEAGDESARSARLETWQRRTNGTTIATEIVTTLIADERGRVTQVQGTSRDVTARKRAEAELAAYRQHLEDLVHQRTEELEEARAKAEEASRAKSAFLANMSHEIRTPMNAVLGFTHLLQRELRDPVHLERLDRIKLAGRHLLGLINDILDLSKIEADRLTLEETNFNLAAAAEHACSLIAERIAAKHLGLAIDLEPRLATLPVRGDPLRLNQILINLLGNAAKFTEHGHVALRGRINDEAEDSLLIRFEVEDTGIGISAENLPLLFEPFQQGEASTTRRFGGTGLGLVISRRLARMMGGDAGVRSEVGVGSTFWFTVRLKRSDTLTPATLPDGGRARSLRAGARVLLVEDNVLGQQVAREVLEAVGLRVEVAGNGAEALERVAASDYDVVLMDMQMPVMDGLEATRRLRATARGQSVPVLAMTANAYDEDRRRCIEAGMNGFVAKPVEPSQLYAALADWIPDGESALSEGSPSAAVEIAEPPAERLLDEARGLAYVGGRRSSYRRLLGKFAEMHGGDAAKVQAALAADDRGSAERTVHTVKGVAAMLGAVALQRSAGDLETRLRANEQGAALDAAVTAFAHGLEALRREIDEALVRYADAAPAPASAGVATAADVRAQLRKLRLELSHDDMAAVRTWADLRAKVAALIGSEPLAGMQRAIDAYDYPRALEAMDAVDEALAGLPKAAAG